MSANFDVSNNGKMSLGRDRFELLSAYLDGEATAAEREQVQQWLDTDPKMQQLYSRLLMLRQSLQSVPAPKTPSSSQQLAQAVFEQVDRRQQRRRIVWGGGAIAAILIGAFSGFGSDSARIPQMASESDERIMIAINRPAVEIPSTVLLQEKSKLSQQPLKLIDAEND